MVPVLTWHHSADPALPGRAPRKRAPPPRPVTRIGPAEFHAGLNPGAVLALRTVSAAYAASFREGLEEQRCHAYEQLFALELADGSHNSVIAELLAMVQAYPLHERFAAQLMLALYRLGRPAEALRVTRELRRGLADQHGLDPGPELSELELRILRNDGSLRSPEAPAGSAAGPRPSQLPPDVADFVGRDEQLAVLDSLLPTGRRDLRYRRGRQDGARAALGSPRRRSLPRRPAVRRHARLLRRPAAAPD